MEEIRSGLIRRRENSTEDSDQQIVQSPFGRELRMSIPSENARITIHNVTVVAATGNSANTSFHYAGSPANSYLRGSSKARLIAVGFVSQNRYHRIFIFMRRRANRMEPGSRGSAGYKYSFNHTEQ